MSHGVFPLSKISAADLARVGGKAANLARLIQGGLPVPAGLAVSLDAFDKRGKLTADAQQAVMLQLVTGRLYAVRSSALAEDAEGASWAGQFETFLNVKSEDVPSEIEKCHDSTKARAVAYASDKAQRESFEIAVVVQGMVQPEYAGVLFTQDPITGADQLVTEYVEGLGEELVSGRADPKRLTWQPGEAVEAPFDAAQLAKLAQKAEQLFGMPQDIEWVWADSKLWLVQARPITATQTAGKSYYLGEPEELFYWGPTRAQPMYMSDFMVAAEAFWKLASHDPNLPSPPKTLVLFCNNKMVWLNNARAFADFAEALFAAYEKRGKFNEDLQSWQAMVAQLDEAKGDAADLVQAWQCTIFAEFSLYGAESVLIKRLQRFDASTRQEIWGAFTVPDTATFLGRIDDELLASKDPAALAQKYPWIEDGYAGLSAHAEAYFTKRLAILKENPASGSNKKKDRAKMTQALGLSAREVSALDLARNLAAFMDERKAWMMRTRRYIQASANDLTDGWIFDNGETELLNKEATHEFWERYVDFKVSNSAVEGIVASNGGRHFINGTVKVVGSPTDAVPDGQIVVVPSTSPSYVPLMRNARALITDHGGMMSHAAIVAREFNLPCIVGTKQATKVLKDGDKVVLDLLKGIVNK